MVKLKKFVSILISAAVISTAFYGIPSVRALDAAFFVATNGSDTNDGSEAAPFKTLEKARDAMRGSTKKTTYIRGGVYRLSAQLDLTSSDSGTKYAAYPGEKPYISGGELVSGTAFTADGSTGNYKASVSGGATDIELFVDGKRMYPAQKYNINTADPYMKESYKLTDQDTTANKRTFKFRGTDIESSDVVTGAKIEIFGHWSRQSGNILNIASVNTSTKVVTLSGDANENIVNNGSYRILNNPSFVNQPGEFAWRASDSTLVIRPENLATLQSKGAVVPRLTALFNGNGVNLLRIDGLIFCDTKYSGAAISLSNSTDCTIINNTFQCVGDAVALKSSSSNDIIQNTMNSLGGSGVTMFQISGSGVFSNYNNITYNTMTNIGIWTFYTGGVIGFGSCNTTVAHNDISDCGRYGVSFKDGNGSEVVNNNIIEYNKVLRTNRRGSDSGAIETLGRSYTDSNNIIRYNRIEDTGGLGVNFYNEDGTSATAFLDDHVYSFGVYLDDKSSGTKIYNNFIKDSGNSQVYIHAGKNNEINNNFMILANPNFRQVSYGDGGENAIRTERSTDNITSPINNNIHHNIIYGVSGFDSKDNDYWLKLDSDPSNIYNYNCLYRVPKFTGYSGQEASSQIADPLFNNEASGDFSLKSGSPALSMGITDLPWNQMGAVLLCEDFQDQAANGFTISGGTWAAAADGQYHQSNGTGASFSYYTAGTAWTNYTASADIYAGGAGGLLFRFKDTNNFYVFRQYDGTTMKMDKKVNGTYSTVATINHTYTTNTWHNLKATVNGSSVTLYEDGAQVWSGTISDISSGTVGCYTSYNTAKFDNVTVK